MCARHFFCRRICFTLFAALPMLVHGQTPAPVSAAFKHEPVAYGQFQLQAGILIFILLMVLIVVQVTLRRRLDPAGGKASWNWRRALRLPANDAALRVVATTRLDGRASLHVIEWEGTQLLIARSEHSIALLAEHPPRASSAHPFGDGKDGGSAS